jgi:hypothetical protein
MAQDTEANGAGTGNGNGNVTPLMAAMLEIADIVTDAGFIDSPGGMEWEHHHAPELPEGTFRLDGPFAQLARKVAIYNEEHTPTDMLGGQPLGGVLSHAHVGGTGRYR